MTRHITREEAHKLNSTANELKYNSNIEWTRFNYCQAYTSNLLQNRYYLIKSYNTIVGLVDTFNNEVIELGKYSRTTSKQFTQICNQVFRGYNRVLSPVANW